MASTLEKFKAQKGGSQRTTYIFGLTLAVLMQAAVFAFAMPDATITKTVVEESYAVLQIVVISYLAASSLDKTGALNRIPGLRPSARGLAGGTPYDSSYSFDRANEPPCDPVAYDRPLRDTDEPRRKEEYHAGSFG